MKRLIAFVLAVMLIVTVSGSVHAEEEEKTWDELYEEGCRAFQEGDMEKAAAAFDASLEACGDNEIVPALMRCACAVPGKVSRLSVSLQDLEKSIRDVQALEEDLELIYAQKKISKQTYGKFAEMAKSVVVAETVWNGIVVVRPASIEARLERQRVRRMENTAYR